MATLTYDEDVVDEAIESEPDETLTELLSELGMETEDEGAEFIGALLGPAGAAIDPVGYALGSAFGLGGASRGRRQPAGRTPAAGRYPYYVPPPNRRFVTHAQLRSSLAKVQADVRKTDAYAKTVNAKAESNRSRLNQQNAINVRQSKQLKTLKQQIEQNAQISMLMGILGNRETLEVKTVTNAAGVIQPGFSGFKIETEKEIDLISILLPTLMGGGGGLGNNAFVLALALMK